MPIFLSPEQTNEIREEIIEGVKAAKRAGVVCGYPDSFTVTKMIDDYPITVTFPIWNSAHAKCE